MVCMTARCSVKMCKWTSQVVAVMTLGELPNQGICGDIDDDNSVSSGSLSPDLGGVWKNGCPRSPELESDSNVSIEGRNTNALSNKWNVASK